MLARVRVAAILAIALVGGVHGLDREGASSQRAGPRIVAVADVHGSLTGLTGILRAAGLIDAKGGWTGGRARLVQTGDLLDRGDDVRAVLDLMMRLETEARRAGGRVDVLFGNHEGMNVLHDFRDVSPQAYASFADEGSEERRRRAFDARAALAARTGGPLDREAWMAAHPAGFVEYAEAMGPRGRYGRWIRGRQVALRIDDSIFMHAGLAPATTATIDAVNRGVDEEIRSWDRVVDTLVRQGLITRTCRLQEIVDAVQVEIGRIVASQQAGEAPANHVTPEFVAGLQHLARLETWALVNAEGPLWYRGLATLPPAALPDIEALLGRHRARRIVVGHSPQLPGQVRSRFGGRVLLADTGMLSSHYKGGRPSAVEIEGGRLTAIYPSGREPLAEREAAGLPRAVKSARSTGLLLEEIVERFPGAVRCSRRGFPLDGGPRLEFRARIPGVLR